MIMQQQPQTNTAGQGLLGSSTPTLSQTVRDMGAATGNKFISRAANLATSIGKGMFNGGAIMRENYGPTEVQPTGNPSINPQSPKSGGVLGQNGGGVGKVASAKQVALAALNIKHRFN